jgi:hypothetical protein
MASGIYQIRNKANGHRYVGSSNNIQERWHKHISDLNRNKHHSRHLQNAWNKYGSAVPLRRDFCFVKGNMRIKGTPKIVLKSYRFSVCF